MSASVGGECAGQSRLEKIEDASAAGLSATAATTEGKVAMLCWSEPDLASGCETGAGFLFEVAQQVLFAQQSG